MIDITELVDSVIISAIHGKLTANKEFFYRKVCRFYSKTFHTPLDQVYKLEPHDVLLAFYEESIDRYDLDVEEDLQELLDKLYTIEDPEYEAEKEKDIEDFMKFVEDKNTQKLQPKNISTEKSLLEKDKNIPEKLPSGGSINLSYLEKIDNETGEF